MLKYSKNLIKVAFLEHLEPAKKVTLHERNLR